jgi:Domain of unknown function (DUF4365)
MIRSVVADTSSEPDSVATLSSTGSKARFGAAYVRAICSHAGVGFTETTIDEDVLAVDGTVDFAAASVRVQIKCTGQYRITSGKTASWHAEESWWGKWHQSRVPVYFVLVVVDPDDQLAWLEHKDEGTLHRAAAFWVRVDQLPDRSRIRVPKSQRLTAATLTQWAAELGECFLRPADAGGV